jgi:hypothetical protein
MFVVKTANFNFTYDGPIFSKPIDFEMAKSCIVNTKNKEDSSNTVCESDATDVFDYGFWYCDLVEK